MEGFEENIQIYALILARLMGMFFTAPVLSTESIGARRRMILAMLIAAILYPVAANYIPALPEGGLNFVLAAMGQAAVGITIGFLITIIFSSFQIIGEILSLQMGISFSEVLDPQSQISLPLLGTLKHTIGILLFLAVPFQMDGYYMPAVMHMIRAIGYSFQMVPTFLPHDQVTNGVLAYMDQAFATMFLTALKIGIPMVGILFISSLTLGLLGRAAPQMNLINMGIQINIIVGLLVLITLIPVIVPLMKDVFVIMYDQLGETMQSWPHVSLYLQIQPNPAQSGAGV